MSGFSLNKFKHELKNSNKARFILLKKELAFVKKGVEDFLKLALETTSSVSKAQYKGLEMY